MQVIACSVHVSNVVVKILDLSVELVSFVILFFEGILQILRLLLVVFVQLLLVVVQLLDLIVQDLDFRHLRRQYFFVVLLQFEVVHLSVAHVAHAVHFRVSPRETSASLAAYLADRFSTALAVPDWILTKGAGKFCHTQHAHFTGISLDSCKVEFDWQVADCLLKKALLGSFATHCKFIEGA